MVRKENKTGDYRKKTKDSRPEKIAYLQII